MMIAKSYQTFAIQLHFSVKSDLSIQVIIVMYDVILPQSLILIMMDLMIIVFLSFVEIDNEMLEKNVMVVRGVMSDVIVKNDMSVSD